MCGFLFVSNSNIWLNSLTLQDKSLHSLSDFYLSTLLKVKYDGSFGIPSIISYKQLLGTHRSQLAPL